MPNKAQHQPQKSDGSLNEDEEKQARELAAARAHIIHEVVVREGSEEMDRSSGSLAWSGLGAGLTMGLSFLCPGLIWAHLAHGASPEGSSSALVSSLGYPIGFIAAILGRQQLFTENTLTPIVPLLTKPDRETTAKTAKLWAIVFITNFIGSFLFGWACAKTSIIDEPVRGALLELSQYAIGSTFGTILLKGVVAGWVIALLTWVLSGVKNNEILMIFALMYFVGLGNFTHVVVASSEAGYLISAGIQGWGPVLAGFILPALLGNILGGVTLVAMLNHAQVVSGRKLGRQGAR